MGSEKQERLDFLVRMALAVAEAQREGWMNAVVPQADLARLVRMVTLAEKEKDDRQQKAFERLCMIADFQEA